MIRGEQVLLCPGCQALDPRWIESADRCPSCGSTRLSVMLGTVVCRQCGDTFEKAPAPPG